MNRSVLGALLWMSGIRGHIPQHDDFGPHRSESPLAGTKGLMPVLAAFLATVAFLSLALWAAVWLAIGLL